VIEAQSACVPVLLESERTREPPILSQLLSERWPDPLVRALFAASGVDPNGAKIRGKKSRLARTETCPGDAAVPRRLRLEMRRSPAAPVTSATT
jgi:hypothetical protein